MLKSISATDIERRKLQDNISRFATDGTPATDVVKAVPTKKQAEVIVHRAIKRAVARTQPA